jgi:hypothetical protein
MQSLLFYCIRITSEHEDPPKQLKEAASIYRLPARQGIVFD